MDSKVRLKAIIGIVTAVILVLAVVYAVNERQINRLLNRNRRGASSASASTTQQPTVDKNGVYGEQIGDDLKAFLLDDSFFDGYVAGGDEAAEDAVTGEAVGTGTIDPRDYTIRMSPKVLERDIIISMIDDQGTLVMGEGFVVEVNGLHLYKDDDLDGIIYIEDLTPGAYSLRLQPLAGYRVISDAVSVEVN